MAVVWLILTSGDFSFRRGLRSAWAFLIRLPGFLPVFGTGTALLPWGLLSFWGEEYAFPAGLLLILCTDPGDKAGLQPKLVGDKSMGPPLLTLFLLYLGFKADGIAE